MGRDSVQAVLYLEYISLVLNLDYNGDYVPVYNWKLVTADITIPFFIYVIFSMIIR